MVKQTLTMLQSKQYSWLKEAQQAQQKLSEVKGKVIFYEDMIKHCQQQMLDINNIIDRLQ